MTRSLLKLLPVAVLSFVPFAGPIELARSQTLVQSQPAKPIDQKTINQLIQQLKTGNETKKRAASEAPRKQGQSIIPMFISLLKAQHPRTRANAAWVLGNMGESAKSAIPSLIPLRITAP